MQPLVRGKTFFFFGKPYFSRGLVGLEGGERSVTYSSVSNVCTVFYIFFSAQQSLENRKHRIKRAANPLGPICSDHQKTATRVLQTRT